MNTYKVISSQKPKAKQIANKLVSTLNAAKFVEAEGNKPNYLFIVGGDGTFISEIVNYNFEDVNVIGINGGNCGFYSSFGEDDIDELVNKLAKLKFEPSTFLQVSYDDKKLLGINELSIVSSTAYPLEIYFNDVFYEKFRGSGILVGTRTGSTGYLKSAKGAVVFPGIECLEFLELNPLLHVDFITIQSPLILPLNTKIKIVADASIVRTTTKTSVCLDGREIINNYETGALEIQAIQTKAKFLLPNNLETFVSKLRKTFIKS